MLTPIEIGSTLSTLLFAGAACYERMRNRKREDSTELVKALQTDREAWKSAHDAIKTELDTYRVETHRKADENNLKLLSLTDENARLKAATDVTPLLRAQQEQSTINVKILKGLDEILQHISQLNRRPTPKKASPNHHPRKPQL